MSTPALRAPFPWFGGKSRAASLVWERFGDVKNYVEPFFGSGAVMLARPHAPGVETINDADGFVANFWRAVQLDPDRTARYADHPVNENDLHARHAWINAQREDFTRRLEGDPTWFDARIAGWWCWGVCCWIASGWCSGKGPWSVVDGRLVRGEGQGVNRKLVHLNTGQGVNRKLAHLSPGRGVHRQHDGVQAWFHALSERMRNVRVCSGDWSRVCGTTPTLQLGKPAGVFLDPPYDMTRTPDLYAKDTATIFSETAQWCREHGDNPALRVALCGYEGGFDAPDGWTEVAWKARGGYGSQGRGTGRANARRERIWFSPACLTPDDTGVTVRMPATKTTTTKTTNERKDEDDPMTTTSRIMFEGPRDADWRAIVRDAKAAVDGNAIALALQKRDAGAALHRECGSVSVFGSTAAMISAKPALCVCHDDAVADAARAAGVPVWHVPVFDCPPRVPAEPAPAEPASPVGTPRHEFLWIDLETTGIDPATGVVLEFAAVLCEDARGDDFAVVAEYEGVITHSGAELAALDVDPYVRKMHGANGLWRDVAAADATTEEVDGFLASLAGGLCDDKPRAITLAGSSVHFDLAWCRVHFPQMSRFLSHRVFDVSTLRRAAEAWAPSTRWPARDTHRAMADIKATIDEARIARAALAAAGAKP